MQSVDTNVLLRAVIDSGDEQTRLARDLLAGPLRTLHVGLLVVAEFVYVLVSHYGRSRSQTGAIVRWVLDVDSLDAPRGLILAALDVFETHPKLSFEDCLIAGEAQARDACPLWTFDAKLAKQHPAARLVADAR